MKDTSGLCSDLNFTQPIFCACLVKKITKIEEKLYLVKKIIILVIMVKIIRKINKK